VACANTGAETTAAPNAIAKMIFSMLLKSFD
jgi:hypothetical protein